MQHYVDCGETYRLSEEFDQILTEALGRLYKDGTVNLLDLTLAFNSCRYT